MLQFLLKRLAQALVVLLGLVVVTFLLIHQLPGGPARAVLGPKATPQAIRHFDRDNGLDKSLISQLLIYMRKLVHGDLGYSYVQNEPVTTLARQNLPKDVILVGLSYAFALSLAVPLGILQAIRRNTLLDYTLTGLSFVFYSMPSFLMGFLLIEFLSVEYQLLPSEAPQGSNFTSILGHPAGLVMPVLTLGLLSVAYFSRYMRSAALDNLSQDFVRTARAAGASNRIVLTRHVLRNSMIPIVTLLGVSLPTVVAGALITETVFNYPGMGLLFFKAAQVQDYPVLLGFTLLVGTATISGNLLADLAYGVLDPRVRVR